MQRAAITVLALLATIGISSPCVADLAPHAPRAAGRPPLTPAAWTAEIDQVQASFGYAVSSAGDVNNDGYADVIVGAWAYDHGESDEGGAFLYMGGPSGLAATPAWTAEGNQTGASFGISVAGAGDVNGDGYGDVVVGAFFYDNGQSDEGRAYLYLGGPAGLSATPAWSAESDQAYAHFGVSVAAAGDVNGDGYGDVIVGAFSYDNGLNDEGRASVYLGGPAGLAATAAWTAEGNQSDCVFGQSVSGAGDVNHDGFADVIVGAPSYTDPESHEGAAFVYLGSATGLDPVAIRRIESDQAFANLGQSVSNAGDVNKDGFDDILVGTPGWDEGGVNTGRAEVFVGTAAGVDSVSLWSTMDDQSGSGYGGDVASAGDIDGDGFSDIVIGAYRYDNGEIDEGRASVYRGNATGVSMVPAWTVEADQSSSSFGDAVASAGDVNGDGTSDVIVGARGYDNGQTDEGRAYLYLGSPNTSARDADAGGGAPQASASFSARLVGAHPSRLGVTARLELPVASHVSARILSADGRHVATLLDGDVAAGVRTLHWRGGDDSGRPVSAGMYVLRVTAGGNAQTMRVVRLR